MFDFLKKRNAMDTEAAIRFWAWFEENEDWIIDCIASHKNDFIWAVDEKLKPVFPYFKQELEFQFGCNDGKAEFFFFHFGNEDLVRDGKVLSELMPSALAAKWSFLLEE